MEKLNFDEDHQTWEAFKHLEEFRWLFNKLEVALRQGLHAGPAGTAPHHPGLYVSRPIYNTYGMGIGAKKFAYDPDHDYEDFINHAVVPPGHFWCEWLTGPHLSIDYQKTSASNFETRSIWAGKHIDDDNLVKFQQWEKLPKESSPNCFLLPLKFPWWGVSATQDLRDLVEGFNVEMRNGKIIEVHLRHGNDLYDDMPVGTRVIPVWNDDEIPEGVEFRPNLNSDMKKYSANGNLTDVRRGFIITRPQEQ